MEKRKKKLTLAKRLVFILRLSIVIILIRNIFITNYENVFICLLTLFLFIIPYIIENKFKVDIPDFLEILIFLFIYCSEILGEINSFYIKIPMWDNILHTINGFIMGAIGLSSIELLNVSKELKIKLNPIFISVVTFCFSMTIGVCWEFFEYGMDSSFNLDMQKDTIIDSINSVTFDPDNLNNVHTIKIDTVEINNEDWIAKYGGYIDIGLIDTMNDLIVNFIGALTFSIIGYFYNLKHFNDKFKKILIISK